MTLNISGILDAVVSHAMALGRFEQVNGHEPVKNAPSLGLTAAVWVDAIQPVRASGLDTTTVRLSVNVRIYTPAQSEPADAIDPDMIAAVDELCAAYVSGFTFDGLIKHVDVLGTHGVPLLVRAGYLQQSGTTYRVMTITLPLIVNDLWEQVA